MKKAFRGIALLLIAGLLTAYPSNAALAASDSGALVPQNLNYTENPVDIPNPDRGFYRGRWQRAETPFGTTPEVDHRVPVDENSVLYHGRQMPPVEGDDIETTQPYNGVNVDPYVGGTGVWATPSISFMGFDLCNFSSNAFLSREAGLAFDQEEDQTSPESFAGRTGKTQPLTEYALNYIRGLLQKVRDGNGVAFVKFSYDGNGFNYVEGENEHLIFGPEPTYITANNPSAMCDVPGHEGQNWIEYHIWQLKPILQEYEDVIMCVKTGMLGPWGEQHTSPEARNPEAYKKMLDAYLDAVPASRTLLTHAGGFLAWYNGTYGTDYDFSTIDTMPPPPEGSPEARFGFFNDSYSAGYDDGWIDNGSLPEGSRMFSPEWDPATGTEDDWWNITDDGYDRVKLTTWINKQNSILQGEGGIGANVFGTFPGAILEAQQLHTTALNMRHGKYQQWNNFIYTQESVSTPVTFPAGTDGKDPPYTGETKTAVYDPVYEGQTGLEYFRDRMGYRLILRDANASEWVGRNGTLRFEGKIQNVGFGNIVNQKNVSVLLKATNGSGVYAALTDIDARNWLVAEDGNSRADNSAAWRDLSFTIDMDAFGAVPAGDYDIYLKINDPKETSFNRRCIQFANYDIWNADLGANKIGSTVVKRSVAVDDTFPVIPEQWINPFQDVQEGAWYYGAVEYAHSHGLIGSASTAPPLFAPDMPLTRSTAAAMLYRLAGEPATGTASFTDVPEDAPYAAAAAWAAESGMISAIDDHLFAPDSAVTREQLAVMLYRFVGSPAASGTLAGFNDAREVSVWAEQAVTWAVAQKIIQGRTASALELSSNATRAEACVMMQRFAAVLS